METAPPGARQTDTAAPTVLHLGSGKNFREDWLNLDIDATWRPDIVADLGAPLVGRTAQTERFGAVELRAESFDAIVAQDVLEHVRDLTSCMRSCLDLLKVGGAFHIAVPYDLSYGAWQDPTHLRAFNERSWKYYTDWFWYLGWEDSHFRLERLDMVPSPIGKAMVADGRSEEEIYRTPRAVDEMHVVLIKQRVPPELAAAARQLRARPGAAPE